MFHLFVVGLATVDVSGIHRYVAQSLREFSGAYFVSISDYDPQTRCLSHRHLEVDPECAGRVVALLGSRVEDIHTPLSEEIYELVTRKGWSIEKSLHDASFGSVPLPVADALQKALHLDRMLGIAFHTEDQLFGTSLMAMHRDQADPSMDMLQAFRHAASIALRQCSIEQQRRRLEAELAQMRPMELRGRLATSAAPELSEHMEIIRARADALRSRLSPDDPGHRELAEILESARATAELFLQLKDFED